MELSITVSINGERKSLQAPCTLEQALQQWRYENGPFAVAINHCVVQRDHYTTTTLAQGDEIDVLYPLQGG